MYKGLDIAISDEASSTVIHVRGPVSARMCDVGCVFDKLGVDVISCSTMPASSSCDMTLVVVDRYESQPLDDALKQSVTEGLQHVFSAHSQSGSPRGSAGQAGSAPGMHNLSSSSGVVLPAVEQQDAAGMLPQLAHNRSMTVEACRADSASESIPVSKASSTQLSPNVVPVLQQHSGQLEAGHEAGPGHSNTQQPHQAPAGSTLGGSLQGGCEEQQQPRQQLDKQPSVRFSDECSICTVPAAAAAPALLQRTGSGRPPKPALKIDIPSDGDSSSNSRWQNDSSNNSSNRPSAAQQPGGCDAGPSISISAERPHQQQGGVRVQDLTQRLRDLGMLRPIVNDVDNSSSDNDEDGDDDDDGDDDTLPSISCRSGGSSSSAGGPAKQTDCKWQPLSSKSCGDLLLLARQQQMARMQRASDAGPGEGTDGQLDCFGTSRSSLDAGLDQQGDSSRSLGSVDQDQQGAGRRASHLSPAAGLPTAGPSSGSSGGRRRRPPPRTPSRIVLSPVGVDGSGEPSGQPRLFVSIPKSASDERRVKRTGSSCSQSVAATPRVPFTPVSGSVPVLTAPMSAASARGCHSLKQLSTSLVGRKTNPISPTAAAAAAAATAAAANMPYNVAVAAAQLLSANCANSSSTAREAAAAVVAAAAEKGDSSTPLPSPLHVSRGAPAQQLSQEGVQPESPPVPRTSPCFQHPPPTPVHPAVAAAAAAAITAAADAAAHSQSVADLPSDEDEPMQLLPMSLPACLSPQRSSFQLSTSPELPAAATLAAAAAAVSASIPETSEEEDHASNGGSSSEEWWCGELTGLTVRDIMTGPVKAVSADADMLQARQLMMQHNLPGMLVDAGPGQQPGFLTRGDFFKASLLRRKGSRKRPHKPCVRDIMGPVLVVDIGMSIESCAQAMQEASVRHAAVRDESAAAAAGDSEGEGGAASDAMAAFVGLVSDAAIYRCLGLYPDDAGAGEEGLLEDGLLGLPHALRLHSGLDSSFDSSGGGTDTPVSSRSRVATPLLDHSARDAGGPQQERQQREEPGAGRQASLVKLPDIVMLREGLGGLGSSADSSICSVRSGAAPDTRKATGEAFSDDAALTHSGSFALTGVGSDGSNVALPAMSSAGAATAAGPPDALARYKHAAALWEVDMEDLEMLKRIGEGSFGEVMLANYRGTKVAVKRLRVLDLDDVVAPSEQYAAGGSGSSTQSSGGMDVSGSRRAMGASQAAFRQFFEREIAILASIRHPNVVNFIGACHKPGQRCLVTEYCARGSLDQVLHKSGLALDLTKRIEFALDIARGMACLHAQRPIIIHRDLKTANLLVSARFEIKVADFGLSRIKDASHLQVSRAGLEGTIEYCAPEVLRGEPYTERCDVYSFGVVLWELLLRQRPYSDAEVPVFLLMVNIGNGTLCLPEVPVESATPGLVEILDRCLAFSASDRPEFREVLALLETEYRALRARQPPRQNQQQGQQQQAHLPPQQQRQQLHAVLRCDSASSLAVNQQSPRVIADSPDPSSTPNLQSPAGTLGPAGHIPPALVASGANGFGAQSRPGSAAAAAASEQDPYGLLLQQQQQLWAGQQQQQQQQPQRHRLSQHDSNGLSMLQTASSGGSATPTFGFQGLQPVLAATPQLHTAAQQQQQQQYQMQYSQQQQQHVFSVPLPPLQLQPQPQQVYLASACNSPRHQQAQQFAMPVVPQLRVMSGFASSSMAAQQPLQQQPLQQQGLGNFAAGAPGGTSVKPLRHKQQLSRARSMPMPQSVAWELEDDAAAEEHGFEDIQEEGGPQDVLLFAEDSFGGVSNCSMTAYSPCPSGQLCMLVEPASSTFGSSSAAGMMPYQQPQQQVLVTPGGQQVAVQQVSMQPVLIQQPGGQLQQAFIQQQPYTALAQNPAPQPQQQPARIVQRALGTPSPTPAVLGRAGTPLSSSPSPGVNHLAIMAAAGAAAAAARREGSASGAASPRPHGAGGSHSRSSSQGASQEMPPLHLLQLGDVQGTRPDSPQRNAAMPARSDRLSSEGGGSGSTASAGFSLFGDRSQHTASAQLQMAPAAVVLNPGGPAVVTPLLLQRLDSLHRSGSSGCSPRCLHRSSSPGLQAEQSGQLLGLLVPGYCSGPASGSNSPRSHSPRGHVAHTPPAAVASVHHLHRPGSSRLAIQGSYELAPAGTAPAGPAGGAEGHHQASPAGPASAGAPCPSVTGQGGSVYGDAGPGLPLYGMGAMHAPPAGPAYHHQYPQAHPSALQPSNRRAPSLLRIDSNSRDRAVSPFAMVAGAAAGEPGGFGAPAAAGHAAAGGGVPVAAAPAGTCSRTLSPFAAASSGGSSLEDVASRGDSNDVVQPGVAAGAAAAGVGAGRVRVVGGVPPITATAASTTSVSTPVPARFVSPFAAAAGRQDDDGDTDAVFDTSVERVSRSASPAPAAGKQGVQGAGSKGTPGAAADSATAVSGGPAAPLSANSSSRRLASPFALMQQQDTASEQ